MLTHGTKYHFRKGTERENLVEHWWYLLEGAYYLFDYNKIAKEHCIFKVIIKKNEITGRFREQVIEVDYIPDWLKDQVSELPEYEEESFSAKYHVYSTERPADFGAKKIYDRSLLAQKTAKSG